MQSTHIIGKIAAGLCIMMFAIPSQADSGFINLGYYQPHVKLFLGYSDAHYAGNQYQAHDIGHRYGYNRYGYKRGYGHKFRGHGFNRGFRGYGFNRYGCGRGFHGHGYGYRY